MRSKNKVNRKKHLTNVNINQEYHHQIANKDYHNTKNSRSFNRDVDAIQRYQFKPRNRLSTELTEVKHRINSNILKELLAITSTSGNLLEVYQRFTAKYDKRILLVLNIFDWETLNQLNYLDKHQLIRTSLTTSEDSDFDFDYQEKQKMATQQALSKLSLNSLKLHEKENAMHFVKIYLLSDKAFANRLEEWDLPFKLCLIDTHEEVDEYINDQKPKILIIGQHFLKSKKLQVYLKNENPARILLYSRESVLNNNFQKIANPSREKLIATILELQRNNHF